jgi:hypothetical protein
MTKTKTTLLRLTITSILAAAATAAIAATAATAAAQGPKIPLFSFCKFVGAGGAGSFNNAACTGPSVLGGAWALAYAHTSTALLICLLTATTTEGLYTNLYCNELLPTQGQRNGPAEIFLRSGPGYGTPTILGIPLDTATLKSSVAGVTAIVSCTKGKFSIQPEDSGKFSEGKLLYTGCTAPKPAGCTVKEPIEGSFNGQLLAADKVLFIGNRELANTAKTKEIFTEITYGNNSSCIVKGQTFPVHGQQSCEGAVGILTLKLLQTLICRASESSLKLGGEPATYENEVSLHTTNKEYWAILLVTL